MSAKKNIDFPAGTREKPTFPVKLTFHHLPSDFRTWQIHLLTTLPRREKNVPPAKVLYRLHNKGKQKVIYKIEKGGIAAQKSNCFFKINRSFIRSIKPLPGTFPFCGFPPAGRFQTSDRYPEGEGE